MKHWMIALMLATAPALATATPGPSDAPRGEMAVVFQAMAELLVLSSSQAGFAPERVHPQAATAFDRLGDASMALLEHAEDRAPDFFASSRGLVQDVEAARLAFDVGRFEEARFRLELVTGRCIDCHSRVPDLEDSRLSDRWLESARLQHLPRPRQARLLVATRRFDAAMDAWEATFAEPTRKPLDAEAAGLLRDYLAISIRVKRDLERPQAVLLRLADRADTPRHLKRRLRSRAAALAAVEASRTTVHASDEFARAKALIEDRRKLAASPFTDEGLVHDLVASSLILTWIDSQRPFDVAKTDPELAEAWWLLGRIESRVQSIAWFSRMEVYMESAVRAAPAGPFAELAYEALEESLLVTYGAPTADGLPEPERKRLEDVRALLADDSPAANSGG